MLYSEIGNKQAALANLQKATDILKQQSDQGSYDQTEFYIRQLQKLDINPAIIESVFLKQHAIEGCWK